MATESVGFSKNPAKQIMEALRVYAPVTEFGIGVDREGRATYRIGFAAEATEQQKRAAHVALLGMKIVPYEAPTLPLSTQEFVKSLNLPASALEFLDAEGLI